MEQAESCSCLTVTPIYRASNTKEGKARFRLPFYWQNKVKNSSRTWRSSGEPHLSHLGQQTPCTHRPPKSGRTLTVSNLGTISAGEFASPVLDPGRRLAIVAIEKRRGDRKGECRLKVRITWSGIIV